MKATCPDCGVRASVEPDSDTFLDRGTYKGRPLKKCERCYTTFYLPSFNRAPRRVNPSVAHEMEMDRITDKFLRMGDDDE